MAISDELSLDTGDFSVFSDSSTISPTFTERDAAIIASMVAVLLDRNIWEDMSDSAWDTWEARIAAIGEQLS